MNIRPTFHRAALFAAALSLLVALPAMAQMTQGGGPPPTSGAAGMPNNMPGMQMQGGMAGAAAAPVVAPVPFLPINTQNNRSTPDASPGAAVAQVIGVNSQVTIIYHRPYLKGRKAWTGDDPAPNTLVPHNEVGGPWRAGANENTLISFSDDVKIEGQALPKGVYSLWIIPTGGDWTIVFNKATTQWGTAYLKAQDALRVKVKPSDAPDLDQLEYTFADVTPYGCTPTMHWGTKKVGFKVELASQTPVPMTGPPIIPRRGGGAGRGRGARRGGAPTPTPAPSASNSN